VYNPSRKGGAGSVVAAHYKVRGQLFRSMITLLRTFFDIALWRKGPQDLPASWTLAALALIAYVAMTYLRVRMLNADAHAALVWSGVPVIMLCLWLWAVLAFFGRRQRFVQTITAALGVGVLLLLLDIGMRALQISLGVLGADRNWPFAYFLIFALVMGRIFMQALDRGLLTGIALTVAILYSTEEVAALMLLGLPAS
jgi:hypothetical protein